MVQRKRLKTFASDGRAYPRIHALVFDPKDGYLNRLPVKFREEIEGMEHGEYRRKTKWKKERESSVFWNFLTFFVFSVLL